ncbi:DUF4328 domain-containing protein [Paenimyroides ceti]
MTTLKPNLKRAKRVLFSFVCLMVLQLVASGYYVIHYLKLQNIREEHHYPENLFEKYIVQEDLLWFIYTIVFLTAAILFLHWFRRAYRNLTTKAVRLKYSEQVAVWSWFIPFLNLLRPYQIMRELFSRTYKLLDRAHIVYGKKIPVYYLKLWWFMGWGSMLLMSFSNRYKSGENELSSLITQTILGGLSFICSFLALCMFYKLVKAYSKIEKLLILLPDIQTVVHTDTDTETPVPVL